MIIINQKEERRITFEDIDIGDVFKTLNGEFFMKCEEVEENCYNCVNLAEGTFDYCEDYLVCKPCNAKLIIE